MQDLYIINPGSGTAKTKLLTTAATAGVGPWLQGAFNVRMCLDVHYSILYCSDNIL